MQKKKTGTYVDYVFHEFDMLCLIPQAAKNMHSVISYESCVGQMNARCVVRQRNGETKSYQFSSEEATVDGERAALIRRSYPATFDGEPIINAALIIRSYPHI